MATKAIDAPAQRAAQVKTRRIRKIFGNVHEISEMPNLIEVQRESYEQFLRSDPSIGYVSGLEKTLRSVFPIEDFAGTAHLDFDRYELEAAEVRHGRVPPARPHLCRADARHPAPDHLRDRSRDRDQVGHRYQGAGRLHGRHAAHDAERHVHRQRHRARDRQPDAPFAGRPLRPRPRQDPRVGQVSSSPPASSPIAAAGSTSSSTPRTSSTSASTASASFR